MNPPSQSRIQSLVDSGLVHGGLLCLLTAIVYLPTFNNGFVWRDEVTVAQPALLASPGLLSAASFRAEEAMWGHDARGHHAVNLLLHAAAAVLVWRVLLRLGVPGAWLAAAVFAVHPVAVESVAWISQRQNLLMCVFGLASIGAFLRSVPSLQTTVEVECIDAGAERKRTRRKTGTNRRERSAARGAVVWGAVCLLLFVGAMLSQPAAICIPAALLILVWWKSEKVTLRDTALILILLLVGVTIVWRTGWGQPLTGPGGEMWELSLLERSLLTGRALWFYAVKLLWPHPLAVMYPRWDIDVSSWWQYLFPLGAITVLAALWLARGRIGRGPFAAVMIFGVVILPELGWFTSDSFRYAFVADHVQYAASIPLLALAAAALVLVYERLGRRPWAAGLGLLAILAPLAAVTWQRVEVFESPITLLGDTVAKNPSAWPAYEALGIHFRDVAGDQPEAIALFQRSIEIRLKAPPQSPGPVVDPAGLAESYLNLAAAQRRNGQPTEAGASAEKAIAMRDRLARENPTIPKYRDEIAANCIDLGLFKMSQSLYYDAEAWFQEALDLRQELTEDYPNNPQYLDGLAWCYVDLALAQRASDRKDEALKSHRSALEIREKIAAARPTDEKLQNQVAASLVDCSLIEQELGNPASAEQGIRKALELRNKIVEEHPKSAEYQEALEGTYLSLAQVNRQSGQAGRAEASYRDAISIREKLVAEHPESAPSLNRLASLYVDLGILQHELGRPADAATSCRRSVEIREELVKQHPKVVDYQAGLAWSYANLGAALLNGNQVDEAVEPCRQAVAIREKLARDFPNVNEHQAGLGWSYTNLAHALAKIGKTDEAQATYRSALNIRAKLLQMEPTNDSYEHQIALSCRDLANLLRVTGELDEAITIYRTALEIRAKLARNHPDDRSLQSDLAVDSVLLAEVLALQGNWSESAQIYARAVPSCDYTWQSMWISAMAHLAAGDQAAYQQAAADLVARHGAAGDAESLYSIVLALVAGEKSLADMNQVVELAQRAVTLSPDDPKFVLLLGAAQYRAGQLKESIVTLAGALSKLDADPKVDTSMPDKMLVAQMMGERLLAAAYREQTGRSVPRKREEALRRLIASSGSPRPQPTDGFPPWAVRSTAEIAERELARFETPPAAK